MRSRLLKSSSKFPTCFFAPIRVLFATSNDFSLEPQASPAVLQTVRPRSWPGFNHRMGTARRKRQRLCACAAAEHFEARFQLRRRWSTQRLFLASISGVFSWRSAMPSNRFRSWQPRSNGSFPPPKCMNVLCQIKKARPPSSMCRNFPVGVDCGRSRIRLRLAHRAFR